MLLLLLWPSRDLFDTLWRIRQNRYWYPGMRCWFIADTRPDIPNAHIPRSHFAITRKVHQVCGIGCEEYRNQRGTNGESHLRFPINTKPAHALGVEIRTCLSHHQEAVFILAYTLSWHPSKFLTGAQNMCEEKDFQRRRYFNTCKMSWYQNSVPLASQKSTTPFFHAGSIITSSSFWYKPYAEWNENLVDKIGARGDPLASVFTAKMPSLKNSSIWTFSTCAE